MTDLELHFFLGILIALPAIRWPIFILLAIGAGVGKELFDLFDYGLFDPIDMMSTTLGALIVGGGILSFRLIFFPKPSNLR